MANPWKYSDSTHRVVVSVDGRESHLATAGVIVDYVSKGGTIDNEDPLSPRQQFEALQIGGVELASTSKPAFNAVYDIDGPSWQMMKDEAQYVATFQAFSGGLTELDWQARNKVVVFSSIADFLVVVRALGDFLTSWNRFVAGQTQTEPSTSIQIA